MLYDKSPRQIAAQTLIKELRDYIFEAIANKDAERELDLEELRQMIKLIDYLELDVKAE